MSHRLATRIQAVVARRIAAQGKDAGQGTIEYLGIAVLLTVLIAGLVTAFGDEITESISTGISDAIDSITGNIG